MPNYLFNAPTAPKRYPSPSTTSLPGNQNLQVGNWPGSASGKPNPAANLSQLASDYPVTDYTGKVFNSRTKQPWHGVNPWDGKNYDQGVLTPDPNAIDTKDPNQRYKPVDILKSPEIAGQTSDLLATFKKNADASLKGFDEHVAEYTKANTGAFNKSQAATNIDGITASLRGEQSRYNNTLEGAKGDYANLNAQDAAAQHAILDRANGILPEYDRSAQAIGDRQLQELQKNLSRYKMRSGTPGSAGSDEMRIAARGAADVLLPLEQARIQRKYDILNNLEVPMQRDITNRETARISSFNPAIAAQEFQSGQATENTIQGLKMQVSTMSFDAAERYMRSLGVPETLKQQILSGQISQLGQLAGLEDQSRYRGLMDVMGANLSQPVGYNNATPGFPAPNRYYPGGDPRTGNPAGVPGGAPALAPNAPINVDPRGWQPAPAWSLPPKNPSISTGVYDGTQSNSYYDASRGIFVDRYTGQQTGTGSFPGTSGQYQGDVNIPGGVYA